MENEILEKIKDHDQKLDEIYKSVEKTRKYFLWTMIITLVTFLLPLIGLIIIVPWFLKVITSAYSGLGI
jgi:TRAP-type mannitol/chloroaromatic compound transport system permease small subunit